MRIDETGPEAIKMKIPKKKRGGRPAKLNDDVRDRLVAASRLGLTRALQAEYANISATTLQRWLATGRQATKGKFRALWLALKQSEAEGAFAAMTRIEEASKTNWKAGAWLMERRHGYRRNGPSEARRERFADDLIDEDPAASLRRQIGEVIEANRQALQTGSFQAYFAGQRLQRNLVTDLAELGGGETPGLEDMGTPAFGREFKAAAMEWPDQLLEIAIKVYEERHEMKLMKVIAGGKA